MATTRINSLLPAIYLFLLLTQPLILFADPDLVFKKILTSDGLSHSSVHAITQDNNGFIWIGTREGLNIFDSYNIRPYFKDPYIDDPEDLNTKHITALGSAFNKLYIGTANGLFLHRFSDRTTEPVRFRGQTVSYINDIFVADNDVIYVCADAGLFSINTTGEVRQLSDLRNILGIVQYKDAVFWLIYRQGIALINHSGEIIKQYNRFYKNGQPEITVSGNPTTIYKSDQDEVWIGTRRDGVFRYDPTEDRFNQFFPLQHDDHLEANMVRAISEDSSGNIWVGTELGLYIIDLKNFSSRHVTHALESNNHALSDKAVYDIFRSREGIMWIGTYFGGINYTLPVARDFNNWYPGKEYGALGGKAISQIVELSNGELWIGTEDGGITVLDPNTNTVSYHKHIANRTSLSVNNVHAIHEDHLGDVWIGTFRGGLDKYCIKSGEFSHYNYDPEDEYTISNNMIYSLFEDSNKNLWVGTRNGLNLYQRDKDRFERYKPDVFSSNFIYDIIEDQDSNIWFCATGSGIIQYDTKQDVIHHFNKANTLGVLPNNDVICAYEASDGSIWFGMINGGMVRWDQESKSFSTLTTNDGLPNNTIYGILEDDNACLWVSSNMGLSRIHLHDFTITNFTTTNGLINNQFNFKSAYKVSDGTMYFGTVNGLSHFHPNSLLQNQFIPEIFIDGVQVMNPNNREVDFLFTKQAVSPESKIILKHDQKIIHINFGAISYRSSGQSHYEYMMEGFDDQWRSISNTRMATYTNLPPGDYVFHVRASIDTVHWSDPKTLHFIVTPPFWKTFPAFLFYILVVLLIAATIRKNTLKRQKEKWQLKLERIEKQKIKELNQHKINFFTYFSHELKTPLTLIIASAEKLINQPSENNPTYTKLINVHAKKMHHLINQLMEFRKVESEFTKIQLDEGDLIAFTRDTFKAFHPLFETKDIDARFVTQIDEYITFFDREKLEIILMNLVSNAVKYTPNHGSIILKVDIDHSSNATEPILKYTITDNGAGFEKHLAHKILMPFYKIENNGSSMEGSGIGLALVDSLVRFLKGNINVNSIKGKGTIISITIPLPSNDSVAPGSSKIIKGNPDLNIDLDVYIESATENGFVSYNESEFEILIVDDNKDISSFLCDHYSKRYKITRVSNGAEALEAGQKKPPDIILCDVLMPVLDGISFCQKFKADINTSHIPIILMTADASTEKKIESLEAGADYFLYKPFSIKELDLIIKNLLSSRNTLQKHFQKFGSFDFEDKQINNQDQQFLSRLNEIISNNIDNSDFDVSLLVQEAGVSRSLLHSKLKCLINLSATGFIKTKKIQYAKQLLIEGYSVSETAYRCGFADPSYFSRTFKELTEISPKEYIYQKKAKKSDSSMTDMTTS